MYGLVNRAIEGLLTTQYGAEKWEAVKSRAGIGIEGFVSMHSYPDSVTYDLVAAASAELELPADVVLEAFGEYWIRYSATEGYGELLDMWGDNLVDFLKNMNNLHARVSLSFPELKPPSISVSETTDSSFKLHYRSDREGLAPFVVGLLRGLGARFGVAVEVSEHARSEQSVVFAVAYHPLDPN